MAAKKKIITYPHFHQVFDSKWTCDEAIVDLEYSKVTATTQNFCNPNWSSIKKLMMQTHVLFFGAWFTTLWLHQVHSF